MKTLSQETSKKIAVLGIEIKTQRWWGNRYIHRNSVGKIPADQRTEWILFDPSASYPILGGDFPAPNLQETLLALEAIGEKLGWQDKNKNPHLGTNKEPQAEYKYHAHRLTDALLTGGMSAVDKYVGELLK